MIWLWIILAFIQGGFSGGLLIALIPDDWFDDSAGQVIGIIMVIGGLLTIIIGAIGVYISNRIKEEEGKIYWCWNKSKGTIMWIWNKNVMWAWNHVALALVKRKDHKEMDKNEDEWNIERLGIK